MSAPAGEPAPTRIALQAGGTLGTDALYIQRKEDARAFQLLHDREYVNILTTRQMGKSSLMTRLRDRLRGEGARTIAVDLAGDIGTPQTADEFYLGILDHVVAGLALDVDVNDWWRDCQAHTANQKLVAFFRDVAMAQSQAPVVVFLDEIDATLKLPFSDDLFTAIRTLFNGRADHPDTRDLVFCLLGTATPSELIQDRRTTPYNIGHTIELVDFDPERDDLSQLAQLLAASGRDGEQALADVLGWTGGHPFLTITMCRQVIEAGAAADVDAVIRTITGVAIAEELKVHFAWINRFMAERLQHRGATFVLYADVLAGKQLPPQADAHSELRLSGLVKTGGGYLVVRNRIYRERFGKPWLARTRPARLPASARRSFAGLGAAIVVAVGGLAWQHQRAVGQREDILREVDDKLAMLPYAVSDSDAEHRRDEAAGLIASLPSDAQPPLLAATTKAYLGYWALRADPYHIASRSARLYGSVDDALILSVVAIAKESVNSESVSGSASGPEPGTGTSPGSGEIDQHLPKLSATAAQQHLLATLRLASEPLHVRALGSKAAAVISSDGQLAVWKVENKIAPVTVNLKAPVALAASGDWVAVAEQDSVGLWQTEDASLLRRQMTAQPPCPDIKALALGPHDRAPELFRLAIGCADGRAFVDLVNLVSDSARPIKLAEVRHAHDGTASPVSALALRPGELIAGSLLMWGQAWAIDRAGRATPTLFDDSVHASALDVRLDSAQDDVVVSGVRLKPEATGWAVVYRATEELPALTSTWRPYASTEDGSGIVASDITHDGTRVVSAVQQRPGVGYISVWEPHDGGRHELLHVGIDNVEPRDVAWLTNNELVVAMSDKTLRVISVTPVAAPPRDVYRQWQIRLGLAVDDGVTSPRPLWPTSAGGKSGFATIRGPKPRP